MISLYELRDAARAKGVGFSIVYCECDDSWYGTINSVAPSERWVGKNRTMPNALEALLDKLEEL